jgi:hypothetical protein
MMLLSKMVKKDSKIIISFSKSKSVVPNQGDVVPKGVVRRCKGCHQILKKTYNGI